jgi:hypothetical protein
MIEEWKVYKDSRFCKYGKQYKKPKKSYWGALYEVSNLGRVKKNGNILNLDNYIINSGYYCVGKFLVHRAVAELFIPNPYKKSYVDHIDTNIHNNRVDNLRWVTPSENNLNKNTRLKKIGQKRTPEQKIRISEGTRKAEIGRKWYNDGVNSYFIYPENALSTYKEGRIIKHRRTKKEMEILYQSI